MRKRRDIRLLCALRCDVIINFPIIAFTRASATRAEESENPRGGLERVLARGRPRSRCGPFAGSHEAHVRL